MRIAATIAVLVALAGAQAQDPRRERAPNPAPPPAREESGITPESLLQLAHGQAQEMPAAERAALLSRAIVAAQRIDRDAVRPWTEELFGLMPEVPEARRASLQVPAVTAVASQDVDAGLDFLERTDAPAPEMINSGADPRMPAAGSIFSRYWSEHGAEGLDRMRTVAGRLGAGGVYPYGAFDAPLIGLSSKDPAARDALFADLLGVFRSRAGSYAEISEFERFLLTARVRRDGAFREGLTMAVAAIDRLPERDLPAVSFRMYNAGGSAQLDGAASVLLMRILPLLKQVDPAWAQRELEKHPDLARFDQMRAAPGDGGPGFAVMSSGRGSNRPAAPRQQVGRVLSAAESSPEAAQMMAQRITDPTARAAANAEIAASLARRNPQEAAAYLGQARQALDAVNDPEQEMLLLTSLARAAYAGNDLGSAAAYTERGLTIAEQVVRADFDAHPERQPMSLKGVSEMTSLVATGMRIDPVATVARIQGIRYPLLRAHLMLSAAEALAQRRPVRRFAGTGAVGGTVGSGPVGGIVREPGTTPRGERPAGRPPDEPRR